MRNYPIYVIRNRVNKSISPGLVITEDSIIPVIDREQSFTNKLLAKRNRLVTLLIVVSILGTLVCFYILPYIRTSRDSASTKVEMEYLYDYHKDNRLYNLFELNGVNNYSDTLFADDTVMVTVDMTTNDLMNVFKSISSTKSVSSVQYVEDKVYITIFRGAL